MTDSRGDEGRGAPRAEVPAVIEVVDQLARVDAARWDALVGDDNPFVEHAFLALLEESGSVGPGTGWLPRHLLVRPDVDQAPGGALAPLLGAAPLYEKSHSYGEYIFDWAWASAAERAGLPYYPKLVAAVPFTPATGPRLLVHPDAPRDEIRRALSHGALAVADKLQASSVHWLFDTADESEALAGLGYTPRVTHQYHWENPGYARFDDYLAAMTSKRRKEVRRERRRAQSHGLTLRVVEGPELRDEHWRAFDRFYRRTVAYRGGIPYLTSRFFELLADRFAHRVVAVLAERAGKPVAGTLNFRRGDHLYGRYWGAIEDLDALHFECCYYQLIDYAIAEGITLFEAGAQGEHKLTRGFLPRAIHSNPLIAHPGLRAAVDDYLSREREAVRDEIAWLGERSPFKGGEA